MPSTPHYLRFARALASVAAAGFAASCASAVGPEDAARSDATRPPADSSADAVTPADVLTADVTSADALVCPALSMTCPATEPPNSSCRLGGDNPEGCPCLAGMQCNYPGGSCGGDTCTCVVTGDAGVGHWTCCAPCVGPLAPPELMA